MARKERKYHYIYKITCLKNGRYYIGMHSTDNLEDGYMGGGKKVKNSIKKYGKDVHKKEILEFAENREILGKREFELVNEELLTDPLCMNLCKGGHYYDRGWTDDDREKGRNKLLLLSKDPKWIKIHSGLISEALKKLPSDEFKNGFKNKLHTENGKEEIGKKNSIKQKGERNSQFGMIWVYNDDDKINKKISPDELPLLSQEWKRGLKMEYFKR